MRKDKKNYKQQVFIISHLTVLFVNYLIIILGIQITVYTFESEHYLNN